MAHPQMFDDDDQAPQRVRAIALSPPGAAEKFSHGRPVFFSKKTFAHYGGTETLVSKEMVQHAQALLVLLDPMGGEADQGARDRGATHPGQRRLGGHRLSP